MSLEELESAILALAPEDRRQFALWFDDHWDELAGNADVEDALAEEQQAEVLRRRGLALAHPELLEPWDGTLERLRQRLHEVRRQKTASR